MVGGALEHPSIGVEKPARIADTRGMESINTNGRDTMNRFEITTRNDVAGTRMVQVIQAADLRDAAGRARANHSRQDDGVGTVACVGTRRVPMHISIGVHCASGFAACSVPKRISHKDFVVR